MYLKFENYNKIIIDYIINLKNRIKKVMMAFYFIHIAVILETILAIFIALKLNEFILEIKNWESKIKNKSELKLIEIKEIRENLEKFNQKFSKKYNYTFNFANKIITNFIIQGLLKKFVLPKNNFFKKIAPFKVAILWFLATFFFLRNKNA